MVCRTFVGFALLAFLCTAQVMGQCCGDQAVTPTTVVTNRIPDTVSYPAATTISTQPTYRVDYATEYREEEVSNEQLVWDTEIREREITELRQVPETSVRVETSRVVKPVWTTEMRDTSYNVVRQVPETSVREERYVVSKPVVETHQREIVQTVMRPVQQTVLQQRQYTVNRPVTTYQTQVVDQGQYVNYTTVQPGKTYNRLAWQSGGTMVDPVTGATRSQWPGLYWTPMQSEAKLTQQTVYQPNLVAQQVPVTSLVPETVVEQIPVTQTSYQQEQVARIEPYQVQRMVQEEMVRQVPVTTYRQVVERVPQTTPVQVMKMETQEIQKEIPVTTYKTVAVKRVEQYEVKVPRIVQVKQKVLRPYTVERRTPLDVFGNPASTVVVPEQVLPIPGSETVIPPSTMSSDPADQKPPIHNNSGD